MKNNFLILIFLFICAGLLVSCTNPLAKKAPIIKTGVAPVADSEVAVVEMEQPAYGKFTVELYSNIAPEMVKRFKELAREGVYNGTTIHRINQSVIQGGDPFSKDDNPANDGQGKSDKPNVPAEFSDIPYDTGIVGGARAMDVDSQNAQFFITLRRTPDFDQRYTIFGKVIDGMNNVKTVAGTPRDGEKPLDSIKIKSITIQPK